MKIAFIIERLDFNSSSRAPLELAMRLGRRHEVYVFTCQSRYKPRRWLKTGLIVKVIPKFSPGKLYLSLRAVRPQVISFHGTWWPLLAARMTGIPTVKTYYGRQTDAYLENFLPGEKPGIIGRMLNRCADQLLLWQTATELKLAHRTIGISRYTAREAERLSGRPADYIYLGGDYASLRPPSRPKIRSLPIRLLSVSRFTPYKGFHHLIRLYSRLKKKYPDIQLTIAGSGGKKKYCQYLKKLNPAVRIEDGPSDRRLAVLYQHCDIYLTFDRFLFFGLPVIEAAFSGKPTVALDAAAAREVIRHDKTGYVAADWTAYRHYLEKLLADYRLRRTMGVQARQWAARTFQWAETVKRYEQVFKLYR